MKRLAKDPNCIGMVKVPIDWNASKKKTHVFPYEISGFFSTSSKLKKNDPT
jgi:hypothetical protein